MIFFRFFLLRKILGRFSAGELYYFKMECSGHGLFGLSGERRFSTRSVESLVGKKGQFFLEKYLQGCQELPKFASAFERNCQKDW